MAARCIVLSVGLELLIPFQRAELVLLAKVVVFLQHCAVEIGGRKPVGLTIACGIGDVDMYSTGESAKY